MLARYGALATLILVWGTTWAAIRVGLEGIPPLAGVALRFGVAALVLAAVARWLGVPLSGGPRLRWLWWINTLFTFCIPYGVVYWAEQWVPSGLAAMLFATYPLFVAALAWLWLPAERLRPLALAGIVLGFAGVAVIYSEDLTALGGDRIDLAAAVFLLSPAASALASVQVKRWGRGLPALALTAPPMAFTALLMGAASLALERGHALRFDAQSVGALLYLALGGSALTFGLYFWLLERLPATRLALITYAVPVVAVTVGALALDERLTPRIFTGAALVLAGVALALRRPRAVSRARASRR